MGLGLFFFIYLAGGIGAGDVKLMAAIGAFVGVYGVLSCAWLAMILGGVYAIGAMGYQWGLAAAGNGWSMLPMAPSWSAGAPGVGN